MYEIKNVALLELQEKMGKKVKEMSDDELMDVCRDLGVIPEYLHENEYDPTVITGFDSLATAKKILAAFSFSYYMSTDFFRSAHKEKAEKFKLKKKLTAAGTGAETYKLFVDLGFGFYDLQPGQTVELDVAKEWINDYLLEQPAVRIGLLKVKDLDTNIELKSKVSEDELRAKLDNKEESKGVGTMKLNELRIVAKGLNIPDYMKKSKEELTKIIKSKI